MTDPFERLRGESVDAATPPADVIRSRARRIERRRYVALGGGATMVAVIAAVGIFLSSGPGGPSRVISESAPQPPAADSAGGSGAVTGERTKGRVSAPQAETSAGEAAQGEALADMSAASGRVGGALTLSVSVKDRSVGRGAELTLKACNETDAAVSRSFSSGQRYDFDVRQDGATVWHWSHDRVFTQETGSETWGPGTCKSWTATWDGTDDNGTPRPPGEYEAVGVLSSSPPEKTKTKTFCLELC